MNQLSALAGGDSAINDAGKVAGAANTGESIIPFVWTTSGGVQRIPLLPGDNCGQPFSINKHANVVLFFRSEWRKSFPVDGRGGRSESRYSVGRQ